MPTATYAYTAAGLPGGTTVTATGANPEQRSRHWLWSAQQTLLATQAGTTDTATWFGYDAAGRVTQVQFADSSAGYTPRGKAGQVTSVAPPTMTPPAESGAPWSAGPPVYPITYAKGGMVQSESLPAVPPYLAWTTQYVYDQDRLLSQVVRLDGTVFGFFRDAVTGLPTQITAPDDAGDGLTSWTLSHEATGARRLTGLANGNCELQYTYDGTLPHGETWARPGSVVNGAALVRSFDKRLRPKQVDLTVQGLTTSERRGFDLDDLPVAVTLTAAQADIAELQLIRDPQTGRLAELRLSAEPGVPTSAKRLRVVYSYDGFGDLLEKAQACCAAA